jgi:hypothetical protein
MLLFTLARHAGVWCSCSRCLLLRPPLLQMLHCGERVSPVRGCFAMSMVAVSGICFAAMQSPRPPPMQMLCCGERDGPTHGCFTTSMAVVLADALPPWFRRMLGCRGCRFCSYTTLLPAIMFESSFIRFSRLEL